MIFLILLVLLITGCVGPQVSRLDHLRAECAQDVYPVVRPYVATWPRHKANAYFREVVRQCVDMELASSPTMNALYVSGAALHGYSAGFQGMTPLWMGIPATPFGAPNSIGPYGTLGPTWQSFNGFFQPQLTPQQQMQQMLVP